MGKAIILSRVSSLHQDLVQQTEAVLKEVHKDGYKDKDIIIIEDKESAIKLSEEERHGLNRMKECINSDSAIDTIYLYELSRLSRRQLVLFSIRDFLVERHIQLICLKPYFRLLDNDGSMSQTGSLMFSIFSSMSESEMVLKKERMLRGRRHNIAMGKSGGGRPPFGYTTDKDKRYIPHPQQASIIKRIFSDYANGAKSMRTITKELKEEGLFPKTCLLSLQNNINYWIKQEYYTGNAQFPPLISRNMFDKAQKARKTHRLVYCKNTPQMKFLLKGLLRDGRSGLLLSSNSCSDMYYSRRYKGSSILRRNIDPLVWDYALKIYHKYVMNKKVLGRQLQKDLHTIAKKIDTANEDIHSIRAKIDKTEERMIFGKLSNQRGEELIAALSEQLNDKEKRLTELTNQSIGKQCQMNDLCFFEEIDETTLTTEEQIAIVKRIVEKVTVTKPNRATAILKIYNTINDTVVVYKVDCWKHSWEKTENTNVRRSDSY